MNKLIIMSGIQGSGKSTFCKNKVKEDPMSTRVNMDDLRTMIYGCYEYSKYRPEFNKIVADIARISVSKLLTAGYTVYVDSMNLDPKGVKSWRKLALDRGIPFEVVEMKTPIEECIIRDAFRPSPVGEEVIRSTAKKWGVEC